MAKFKKGHKRTPDGRLRLSMKKPYWIYEYTDLLVYQFKDGAKATNHAFTLFLDVVESVERGWHVRAFGPKQSIDLTRYFRLEPGHEKFWMQGGSGPTRNATMSREVEERFKRCISVQNAPGDIHLVLYQAEKAYIRVRSLAVRGWEVRLCKMGEKPVSLFPDRPVKDHWSERGWKYKEKVVSKPRVKARTVHSVEEAVKAMEEIMGVTFPEPKPKPEPTKH